MTSNSIQTITNEQNDFAADVNKHPLAHPDQYVGTEELAKLTGLTKRFWEARRMSGDSPPFIRISKSTVRYRWGDVQEWLRSKTCIRPDSRGL